MVKLYGRALNCTFLPFYFALNSDEMKNEIFPAVIYEWLLHLLYAALSQWPHAYSVVIAGASILKEKKYFESKIL